MTVSSTSSPSFRFILTQRYLLEIAGDEDRGSIQRFSVRLRDPAENWFTVDIAAGKWRRSWPSAQNQLAPKPLRCVATLCSRNNTLDSVGRIYTVVSMFETGLSRSAGHAYMYTAEQDRFPRHSKLHQDHLKSNRRDRCAAHASRSFIRGYSETCAATGGTEDRLQAIAVINAEFNTLRTICA